jgi:hypothetical protein
MLEQGSSLRKKQKQISFLDRAAVGKCVALTFKLAYF